MKLSDQAILFDLDQTLLNREQSLTDFISHQVQHLQLVSENCYSDFIQRFKHLDHNGAVWKDVVYQKLIIEFEIHSFSVDDLLQDYVQNFRRFARSFDDVDKAIQQLYNLGYKIGLISNGKTPFQENNFKALNLAEYFSTIIVSDAVGLKKPDPQIFQLACDELSISPQHCIFVGDNEVADIQGAQRVGMKTIFFHPDSEKQSIHATANLHHFKDLPVLINNLLDISNI